MAFGDKFNSAVTGLRKAERKDVDDDARPGSPSTSKTDENIEAAKKIILENR